MKRTLKEIVWYVKELIERKYDVVKWIDNSTALVRLHNDNGEYYNAVDICTVLEDM